MHCAVQLELWNVYSYNSDYQQALCIARYSLSVQCNLMISMTYRTAEENRPEMDLSER
jgi:hypothetical protein